MTEPMTADRSQVEELIATAVRENTVGNFAYVHVAREVLKKLGKAGFVVVPREPTEEMVGAAYDAELDIYWGYRGDGNGGPKDVYRAMLAAISPSREGEE